MASCILHRYRGFPCVRVHRYGSSQQCTGDAQPVACQLAEDRSVSTVSYSAAQERKDSSQKNIQDADGHKCASRKTLSVYNDRYLSPPLRTAKLKIWPLIFGICLSTCWIQAPKDTLRRVNLHATELDWTDHSKPDRIETSVCLTLKLRRNI